MNEQTTISVDLETFKKLCGDAIPQAKVDGGSKESGLNEKSDCTIRALAVSAGIDYPVAHRIGRDAGRRNRCGFNVGKLIKEAKKNGLQFYKVIRSSVTISKFLQRYPKGRFYCRRSGHAFGVIDGVILDTTPNTPYQRITEAYEFIPKTENNPCQATSDIVE
ncbi:MAG: hypothetical protein EBZ87_03320 [Microbacteriaceae bacterium]|nr:hypothetical protein [Microbacteriaceae bacterium]